MKLRRKLTELRQAIHRANGASDHCGVTSACNDAIGLLNEIEAEICAPTAGEIQSVLAPKTWANIVHMVEKARAK